VLLVGGAGFVVERSRRRRTTAVRQWVGRIVESLGLVITLSGSIIFASGKSALLPAAQNQLKQVYDALVSKTERKIIVEGHTDSQGSSSSDLVLSVQRADAVRSYIISRGYPADLIQAQGIGEDRPVADNANPEGRANDSIYQKFPCGESRESGALPL